MLDLKRYNWVSCGDMRSLAPEGFLKQVLPFLEMEGFVYFALIPQYNNSSLGHFIENWKLFKDREHLVEIVADSGNFFRVNLVVLDLMFCKNLWEAKSYLDLLGGLDCQFIILISDWEPPKSDDSNLWEIKYVMYRNSTSGGFSFSGVNMKSHIVVTHNWEGWESNLEDLRLAWVRDKKIGGFLDDAGFGTEDEDSEEDY
jgi:hypothetical protein